LRTVREKYRSGNCLASAMIVNKDPEAVIGIFPADHYIKNISEFEKSVEEGFRYARDHTALITFGIKPERPATGYGYIQFDKNVRISDGAIYKVKTFAEKPNQATAQRFIESGEFLWNSGMFIWKGINILNAIKIYLPELYECLSTITAAIDSPEFETILKHQWTMIHSISIDYGILEKAKNVYVVSGNFDWSDVGSWDAVYDLKPKDANGNVLIGDVQTIDTNGCYFYSRRNLITAIGVSNLIVVQSKDSILIVNRGESEKSQRPSRNAWARPFCRSFITIVMHVIFPKIACLNSVASANDYLTAWIQYRLWLGNFKDGACLVQTAKKIVINKYTPLDLQIDFFPENLSGVDLKDVYILPTLRELIEKDSELNIPFSANQSAEIKTN
jgi:mannose-1-phosphate guanylyltransferase